MITGEIFIFIGVVCLTSIQLRRLIKGELPFFGLKAFSAASKINLDGFDYTMIVLAVFLFLIGLILLAR
jgi:hypothetical protein